MDPDRLYAEFGQLVRRHRQRLGLTQDQLAERIALARTSITNIERGRQKILLHQLFQLAESMGVSPEAILPTSQPEPSPHVDEKLPRSLNAREREWVQRVVATGTKGGEVRGSSKD
jgi:transcriptional regulator with XRE-family HTH domain